jgi:site-specific recombinase XerD
MNNLLSQYQSYLMGNSSGVKSLSPSTVKNYLSDTRHFLLWLQKAIQEPEIKPEHITPAVIKAYGSDLQETNPTNHKDQNSKASVTSDSEAQTKALNSENSQNSKPINTNSSHPSSLATTNRRLSSLRRFGQFLETSKLLSTDPTSDLLNPNPTTKFTTMGRILTQYQNFLKDEELSNSTIKNYLSDLKSYLVWANRNNQLLDNQPNQRQS